MKFFLSSLKLWKMAIRDKPNIFGYCRHRTMFWDALNGLLYIRDYRYVALKGSMFEEPSMDDLLCSLRES